MNNIKVIKLITGDEVIGKVEPPTKNPLDNYIEYTIKNCIRLVPTQEGLQAVPFMIFADKKQSITINQQHIICFGEPEQEILNSYSKIFGEIISATPKLFVP